jgi:uncharacterized repeat protein (TIGR03803 family)
VKTPDAVVPSHQRQQDRRGCNVLTKTDYMKSMLHTVMAGAATQPTLPFGVRHPGLCHLLAPVVVSRSRPLPRRVWCSWLLLLALGYGAAAHANVIQVNRTYPPPNGSYRSPGVAYNFGSGATAVQFKDVAFTFFGNSVLPGAAAGATVTFQAQFSHHISFDGGATFSGEQAATATMNVTLGTPTGNNYPLTINSLIISGGDLPGTFRLRKIAGALPGSPVVTFTPDTPSPGLFEIASVFNLPMELSQDSGGTWTPNTVDATYGIPGFNLEPLTAEEVSNSPTLPPGDGEYYTADTYHAAFASGIVIRNPLHNGFLGQSCIATNDVVTLTNSLCPPPILGSTQEEVFDSQMQFDLESPGVTHVGPIGASVRTRVHHRQDSGVLEIYDTEMLQLNPNPGTLPPGMNFRINPAANKKSRGVTTIRPGPTAGSAYMASTFALRLQLTTDGGFTWQDADQFTRMNLRVAGSPTPTSYNITIQPGLNLIANQLDHGSNTLDEIMPDVPPGTVLYKFNNASQSYEVAIFDELDLMWMPFQPALPSLTLSPGEGAFLLSPTSFTLTFTGVPHVPVLPVVMQPNQAYLLSAQTPTNATPEDIVGGPLPPGAAAYTYNGAYTVFYFDEFDSVWLPSTPVAGVGTAMWIAPAGGSPKDLPLVIFCAGDKVVECGTNWDFDAPRTSSGCAGPLTLTLLSPVTNGTCPQVVTRTWRATDTCGGAAECSQTVTMVDTTPPVLTCVPDKTVSCLPGAGTNGFDYTQLRALLTNGIDGTLPRGRLVEARDGVLYGTTADGGSGGFGTIYRINKDGTGHTVLRSFTSGGAAGRTPYGGLVEGRDGALYGTTSASGSGDFGTVFKVSTAGTGLVVLHSFSTNSADGQTPYAGLVEGTDGAMYGTTAQGGTYGRGTVFTVNPDGTGYLVLYHFGTNPQDGDEPYAALVEARDGALYGTTRAGGGDAAGTVFKLNKDGSEYAVLRRFTGAGTDGQAPYAGLVEGRDGVLYGTTRNGGNGDRGMIFRLNQDGTGYGVLRRFSVTGEDGAHPYGRLVEGRDGALYGTAYDGGSETRGTVFRLNKDGTSFSVLRTFSSSGGDGRLPYAGLVEASDGALYGTTAAGGTNNAGTLFRLQMACPWDFDPPTVTDACCGTNVTVTVQSTVTNNLSPQTITRVWQATDCCTNTALCSQTVTLLTAGDLAITEQPQSLTVPVGNSALFTVGVTGLLPITYQWQFNGSNIAGATDASFAVEDAQVADAGAYRVVVANGYTTTASSAGTLSVLMPGPPCCTDVAPNLVTNGSFEVTSPAVAPNRNAALPPLTGVPGWDTPVIAGTAILEIWGNIFPFTIPPTGIPASAGTNHLELNADLSDQTVTQIVTGLTPGQPATVCFDYTGRYGKAGATYNNDFTLTLSGGAAMTVSFNPPKYSDGGWRHFSMSFIPNSPTVTIAFRGKPHAPVAGGGHIDDVSLTQPPQPGLACPPNLTLQSPGGGIVVNYPEPVVVGGGLSHCTPPSGSVFPPGITVVTCTATNACGTASCSFTVMVEEVLCCPGPNLVAYGDFEGPFASPNLNGFFAEALTGWDTTETGAEIEFWNGTFSGMAPQHLNQHLEITARSPNATVSQVITGLSTNCPATLCFYYAGRPFYDNHFTLEIEGSGLPAETLDAQTYINAGSWLLCHRSFTPQSSTITLKFTVSGRPPGALPGGAHIDNVCLSQPLPMPTCPANVMLYSPGGGIMVNYLTPAVANGGLADCAPPSGSVFPPGATLVTCTATNDCGSNTCSFTVTVLEVACCPDTNRVVNGSFETPAAAANGFGYFTQAATGWTTTETAGNLEFWNGTYSGMAPQDGQQHLELTASSPNATVSQVISGLSTTCPATLCFYYAGRPFYDNHFTLEIEGSGLPAVMLDGQSYINSGSWLLHYVTFTPQSSTVTLKFTVSGRPPGALPGGAHIDNVCLSQPPPPSLDCPDDITVSVSGGSAVINYPAPVVTGGGLLFCVPPSGSVFDLGTTPVICIATNDCGTNACTFNVTVLQATCPTGVNLVLNGTFESPTVPNNSFDYVSTVPNWATTDSQGEFELWSGAYGGLSPAIGNQHLEINAHDGDETVSQVIGNLDPTCPTTLCFAYTGRYSNPSNNTFIVTVLGSSLTPATLRPVVHGVVGWQEFAVTFLPTSSTVTLQFRGLPANGNEGGAHIDDVRLVQDCSGPTSPVINIGWSAGGLTISWSNPAYHLEESTSLTGGWTPVPGTSPVTVPIFGGMRFFRLVGP